MMVDGGETVLAVSSAVSASREVMISIENVVGVGVEEMEMERHGQRSP